ncbi:MAG: hypothetical protein VSS75_014910 [Candidatus Parabeggiatoa sp.]
MTPTEAHTLANGGPYLGLFLAHPHLKALKGFTFLSVQDGHGGGQFFPPSCTLSVAESRVEATTDDLLFLGPPVFGFSLQRSARGTLYYFPYLPKYTPGNVYRQNGVGDCLIPNDAPLLTVCATSGLCGCSARIYVSADTQDVLFLHDNNGEYTNDNDLMWKGYYHVMSYNHGARRQTLRGRQLGDNTAYAVGRSDIPAYEWQTYTHTMFFVKIEPFRWDVFRIPLARKTTQETKRGIFGSHNYLLTTWGDSEKRKEQHPSVSTRLSDSLDYQYHNPNRVYGL